MSIKQVEIRAFSGPESVELDGIDQPHVVQLNQGPAGPAGPSGVGVPVGGTEGQILAKASDTNYDTEWIDNFATSLSATVRNETEATLTKGTVVYISGSSNGKPLVSKASASSEALSSKTFAILAEDIAVNQNGQAISAGLLRKVNTNGFTPGANIWLSTTPGLYTETMPTAPDNAVFLGNILSASTTQGEIEVRIQNGYELGELHNVSVTGVTGGEVLRYNASTSLWEDVSATELPIVSTVVARDSLGGSVFTSVTYNSVADSDFSATLRSSNDGSLESNPIIELPLVSGGLLVDANNLSELSDFSAARTNLGAGTTGSDLFGAATLTAANSTLGIVSKRKTSQTDRNNSSTYTTDSDFTVAVSAGKTYRVEFALYTTATSNCGFKGQFRIPSVASNITATANGVGVTTKPGAEIAAIGLSTGGVIGAAAISRSTSATNGTYHGWFEVTIGTTGGDLLFQWAQVTSNADNASLLANSTVTVRERSY